ncbi:MAG: hypothetical protein ICV72_14375, partial [Aldersonia sp.]|nr:hypothetical protein [Aldersonia sp.]
GADGSWTSYWWTSPHYTTLQAVHLGLIHGDAEPVERAVEWTMRSQADDGRWAAPGASAFTFATAVSLSVLLAAGARRRQVERAVASLADLQCDDGSWPSDPILRIPLPGDVHPDGRRLRRPGWFGRGFLVPDQNRTFTSAACVAALAAARDSID